MSKCYFMNTYYGPNITIQDGINFNNYSIIYENDKVLVKNNSTNKKITVNELIKKVEFCDNDSQKALALKKIYEYENWIEGIILIDKIKNYNLYPSDSWQEIVWNLDTLYLFSKIQFPIKIESYEKDKYSSLFFLKGSNVEIIFSLDSTICEFIYKNAFLLLLKIQGPFQSCGWTKKSRVKTLLF